MPAYQRVGTPEISHEARNAGRPALRVSLFLEATMFKRRIYRGMPTIMLFVVAAFIQSLAVLAFI